MSREIDALIAEKIFNIKVVDDGLKPYVPFENDFKHCRQVLHYSTDIKAAWEVVEKLSNCSPLTLKNYDKWYAEFDMHKAETHEAFAHTAPMAICLAALAAVGVKVDKE